MTKRRLTYVVTVNEIVKIENWDHFCKLSDKFDKEYTTKTYFYYETLQNVIDTYLPNYQNHKEYWDYTIEKAKTDEWYGFVHFNNLMTFANSFQQFGPRVMDPICISLFRDKTVPHPGNKRLRILAPYLKRPVPVMITDYRRKLDPIPLQSFDFDPRHHEYWFGATHFADKHELKYKEIQSNMLRYNDPSFSFKDRLKGERIFKVHDDVVTCNDVVIMERKNEEWQMTILMKVLQS